MRATRVTRPFFCRWGANRALEAGTFSDVSSLNDAVFADENGEFLQNLKKLTEDTYKKNGNRKVLLLGHSLGNMYISYLLSKQSQSWKDKYINSFINLSGPLGGSAKIMRLLASGSCTVHLSNVYTGASFGARLCVNTGNNDHPWWSLGDGIMATKKARSLSPLMTTENFSAAITPEDHLSSAAKKFLFAIWGDVR